MKMRLYNTLSRRIEELGASRPDGTLGLYTCGPTVYNYLHIGNYRTYVFEDILKRSLKLLGHRVRHVMNITDVGHLTSDADEGEDKLEVGGAREGKTAWEIADFYTKTFRADSAALNFDFQPRPAPRRADDGEPIDIECRATAHIPEQIAMVRRLEERGFTYRTADGIYFDTAKFAGYGVLVGGAHLAGLQEGARVAANREKRNLSDFALWKFSPAGRKRQMEWDSPWGRGFPGWHIECSAMAQTYLGETFDIHCGGVDHIPIHHTNEIAQAEAATGRSPFVRFWVHGEFLVMNKAKMAKSAGGFITLGDLSAKGFDPLDYRYFCYSAHYRRQLEFSWEALEGARSARRRLRETAGNLLQECGGKPGAPGGKAAGCLDRFKACLCDDLNMPQALASVHDALGELRDSAAERLAFLAEADQVLALRLTEPEAVVALPPELQAVFDRYVGARGRKDFAASDSARKELAGAGIRVRDTKGGSVWEKA
ncbi:MAG: cysteine--tRNA ligase [Elusimicrobia bacterium GWA2_69_24]|nr:MAG: cysteine--tRNA ligase [Elusimicrobia bacterium GWA2_69_24]HBL16515.1 cysteine--tRNA ligase [Elusimicrobiota bacterium]